MNALVDAVLALAISLGTMTVAFPILLSLTTQPAQNDAGNQLAKMQVAAASYIRKNNNPAAGRTILYPNDLKNDGDLPATFLDSNVFGQQHVLVVNNSNNVVDGMVYTYGGTVMDDLTAIRVAQSGPPDAAVILSNPTCAAALLVKINKINVCFEGASGGMALSPAAYDVSSQYNIPANPQPNPIPIAPGHIGAYIEPAVYTSSAPFLSRTNTGNPEDNTLHTDVNVNNVNLSNANAVTANSVTATAAVTADSVAATNAVTANIYYHQSDGRLKTDIRPIDHPLDVVKALQGHRFTWKADGRADLGFIAQEVQTVLPEAVGTTQTGTLAVKYDILIAPLVEAVKDQQRQIAALRRQLAQAKGEPRDAHRQ